jgi:hypothetical protein
LERRTVSELVCFTFPMYAYEVQPGDVFDGREVVAVAGAVDGDRPPAADDQVEITYTQGGATAHGALDELAVRRCWERPPPPEPIEY